MVEESKVKVTAQPEVEEALPEVEVKAGAVEVAPVIEPQKKHWWQGRKKQANEPSKETNKTAEPLPDKPTDSLEANLMALARHMEVKERNDYWHLRFKKKAVLVMGGIIILLMWGVAAYQHFSQSDNYSRWSLKGVFLTWKKPSRRRTPTPQPKVMIRIRFTQYESGKRCGRSGGIDKIPGFSGGRNCIG